MTLNRLSFLFALSLLGAASGCNEEEPCAYERPAASIEMTEGDLLVGSPHTFSAADSFVSCDRPHTYTWTFLRVPGDSRLGDGNVQGQGTQNGGDQQFTFDAPGTYVIQVVIFDGVQNSVEGLIVVEVSADNLPPEANAGEDQAVLIGGKAVFDGSASYDPEDKLEEYLWRLEEAPVSSGLSSNDIYAADTPIAEFVPDVDGTYVFSLQVRDEFVWSEKDYVSLVTPVDNQAPIAQASDPKVPDAELTPCESLDPVKLNGTRSYDPEGESLTYEWGLVSAPDGSRATDDNFNDRLSARPLFSADEVGDYTFELRVSDGVLWSAWDFTTVTVNDIADNVIPVADAGDDVTIEGTAKCRNVGGVWKCPECPTVRFELDAATGTYDANGDELSYLWVQSGGPDEIVLSYPGGPITTATPAPLTAEYNRTITRTWTVEVRASDCEGETTSTVELSYECKGDK